MVDPADMDRVMAALEQKVDIEDYAKFASNIDENCKNNRLEIE